MTDFEKAVFVIGEAFREDAIELDVDNMADVIKCYMMDSDDLKEECLSILRDDFDGEFTADCEILDSEGNTVHSFRKLAKAVRGYKF